MRAAEVSDVIAHQVIRRALRLMDRPARRFVDLDVRDLLTAGRRRGGGHEFEDLAFSELHLEARASIMA